MKKLITFIALSINILIINAQDRGETGKISGKVIDGSAANLQFASVSLLLAKDSSVIKLDVAGKLGEYQFEILPFDKYIVQVSAAGFAPAYSTSINIEKTNPIVVVRAIQLQPLAKSLTGVIVSSKKPLVEQKIDRMVVNVDASVTNVGISALEVLEKSPGITVDKDGKISLKGKAGVQIYIDGRPTYLSGTDLTNYLQGLSSSQLDQIEIMTNPPAKYEAAGNSGIINIKTKKTKQFGYSGSLSSTYSQGRYARLNESVNFNYRKNKINFFTNMGYNRRNNFQNLYIDRKFIEASTKNVKSLFSQESRIKDNGSSYYGKMGMDYSPTKRTTLGFVLNGFSAPGNFQNRSNVDIMNPGGIAQSKTLAQSDNRKELKNLSANFNFRHVFDSAGRELTADVDLIGYRSTNQQDLVNAYYLPNGLPLSKADTLYGNLPQDINIATAKIDYTYPLAKGAKLEAGAKTSWVKTDNNAIYDSLNYGVRVRDIGRSNYFIYNENVNAVYLNYSKPFSKKLSGQLGLRVENTNAKGKQVTTGENFDRHYTQLFPTAFFQYQASDKNNFGINYGKRINRPDYEDLNPFLMFLDRYTFEQGNPNLRPQYAHNIELSHTYKGFLTTTLNYTNTTDIINEILEQNIAKNETIIKKANIAKQKQWGIAINAGGDITKWWSGNIYANAFNNLFEGNINSDDVKISASTAQFNISNQFKFAKTWGAELSGYYNTGVLDGVFRIGNFGMVNMGISKQIMKGNGSLRANVQDVFFTQKIKGEIKYSNIDVDFRQVRDSRRVSIGFSYRFNKGKLKASGSRKSGGAADEQSRVKGAEN